MTRTLIAAALAPFALASLAVAVPVTAQEWKSYRPHGAGYQVEFPGQPVEDVQDVRTNVGPVRLQTSSLTIGDKTYMTITSSYPREVTMGDPQKNLDGARDGSLQHTNGTLRSEERINLGNVPARHLVIDLPQQAKVADTLLVLDGHRLLQAIYVGPNQTREAPEARRFLTSFTPVQ